MFAGAIFKFLSRRTPKVALPRMTASAQGADFLRFNLVDYADFAGLPEGIHWISQIFFGEFVDVVVGAIFRDFHDAAADFQVAVRIRGILQRNGNARIAPDINKLSKKYLGNPV